MTLIRLENIANRQRRHLMFDVMIAGLAIFILAIQVAIFSGKSVPVAEAIPHVPQETIYIYGAAPTPDAPSGAVATVPSQVIPGS